MLRIGTLLLALLLLCACSKTAPPSADTASVSTPVVDEDALLMRLSAYLSADTIQAAQQQNAIIGYAIENLLDVQATSSGLFYEVIRPGTGDSIQWGDFLTANYRGYLLDGTVFANSYASKRPLEFYVGNMIDGWNEGLPLVQVGGYIRLLVPSRLGYKAAGLMSSMGRTIVAPDEVLIFEVEILDKSQG